MPVIKKIAQLAGKKGLNVCVHLIVGLPGETIKENLQIISRVIDTGVDGIKLHPLHIVEGSIKAKAWRAKRLLSLELTEYVEMAREMIRHTPKNIIYHRICANARRPTLLAPDWCVNRWLGMNVRYMNISVSVWWSGLCGLNLWRGTKIFAERYFIWR